MYMQTTTPNVHVTNYQQYINADSLTQGIIDSLHEEFLYPENIYVSIAYMQVLKDGKFVAVNGGIKNKYKTVLVLSIKGVTYRYEISHSNEDFYLAFYGLSLGDYGTHVSKDQHIQLLQQAFEQLVFMRVGKIAVDVSNTYKQQ